MGGRCAEELIFGADKVTGGASGDFMGTTNIAEAMVKTLAMSDKLGMSKLEVSRSPSIQRGIEIPLVQIK